MNLVKLQDTKLIHRNLLNYYRITTKDQKEIKETISFTIATKRLKYLGRKDLYSENYKMLTKELKISQADGKICHVLGLEESILSK